MPGIIWTKLHLAVKDSEGHVRLALHDAHLQYGWRLDSFLPLSFANSSVGWKEHQGESFKCNLNIIYISSSIFRGNVTISENSQALVWVNCVVPDNINLNQAAAEVLLFGWELMKRNRHTYGTLFFFSLSFFFLFESHPSIYTQIHMPYGKVWMRRSESSVFLSLSLSPNAAERIKKSPSLVALTPMGTWKWRLHLRPF